jgi:maltose alpha-D-glucosyltransferase/alpha-amylase
MQWSADRYGGFSSSDEVVVPIVEDEEHGYQKVNVAHQRRDPGSLLNWTERRIRTRKELPEIGWGECTVLDADPPTVLVLRYDWRNTSLVTVHNFADKAQTAHFDVGTRDGRKLCDLFDDSCGSASDEGRHELRLEPYGHRWFRAGGTDTVLKRWPR